MAIVKISSNAALGLQNGWPSATSESIQPNSPSAVANVQNEKVSITSKTFLMFIPKSSLWYAQDYFKLLDDNCQFFKEQSIGWFAHTYNDQNVEAYGVYGLNGALKFPFQPKTSC